MYVFGSGQGEWVIGLGLGITNSEGTCGKWCLCFGCSGVCGPLGPGSGRVGCCYVSVCCESGLSLLMAGPGICILCYADSCAS